MEIIYFLIAFFSTTIGAISGLGGGTIIKPMMDTLSGLNVEKINFMSSCAVLSMTFLSIYRGRKDNLDINHSISTSLALGASLGGMVGKYCFLFLPDNPALLQSCLLLFINSGIYFYLKIRSKVKTKKISSLGASFLVGTILGTLASFLGIGGGPINVVVLHFLYSTTPKITAKRSIYIILFAQITSISTTLYQGLPDNLNLFAVGLMILGGCLGAIVGGKISKKLSDNQMNGFFQDVLVSVIALNAFNIGRLLS